MKKVLLTTNHLAELKGSEITILEHIEYFYNLGYEIYIFTNLYSQRMIEEIHKITEGNFFITDNAGYQFNINDYDVIWIQHQLIPDKILEDLSTLNYIKPKIIFIHMSPYIHIEFPWLYDIENKIADVCLVISEEVLEVINQYNIVLPKIEIYRNPTNIKWSKYSTQQLAEGNSKKENLDILIVSNHIPEEVINSVEQLKRKHNVDIIGDRFWEVRVTPEILSNYDIIFTIGKTVQYAILMDKIVYCYDHFGGPGFLTKDNFDKCKWHNFSGRGFNKKNTDEILQEIENVDLTNKTYFFSSEIKNEFIIDLKLESILKNSQNIPKTTINPLITKTEALKSKNLLEMYRGAYRTYEYYKSLLKTNQKN